MVIGSTIKQQENKEVLRYLSLPPNGVASQVLILIQKILGSKRSIPAVADQSLAGLCSIAPRYFLAIRASI